MRLFLLLSFLALSGCGRDWVKPEHVPGEISRQEARVQKALSASADTRAKLFLGTAEAALGAARRALAAGRADIAQQELEVAIRSAEAACRGGSCGEGFE